MCFGFGFACAPGNTGDYVFPVSNDAQLRCMIGSIAVPAYPGLHRALGPALTTSQNTSMLRI
jgi:hypothetical protein